MVSFKDFKLGFSGMALTMEQSVNSSKVPSFKQSYDLQVVDALQLGLSVIVVYKTIVTLIKVSILMIYLRLCTLPIMAFASMLQN